MACCLLESLVRCGGFDPVDQLARYRRWYEEGYYSPLGHCFDIGNTTRRGVARDDTVRNPMLPLPPASELRRGGNGSIMRAAPLTVALLGCDSPAVRAWVCAAQARTTHSEHTSVQCAFLLQEICRALLLGEPKESVLTPSRFSAVMRDPAVAAVPGMAPLTDYVEAIIAGTYAHKLAPWEAPPADGAAVAGGGSGRSSASSRRKRDYEVAYAGYLADECLDAALWAFARTDNFVDGALAAVNLGDDSDTVGAVYGNIAGCAYGLCTAESTAGSEDILKLQGLLGLVGGGGRPASRAGHAVEGSTVAPADLLAMLDAAGIKLSVEAGLLGGRSHGGHASGSGLPWSWATLVWRHGDIASMATELFLAATAKTATPHHADHRDHHDDAPAYLYSGSLIMGWKVPEAIARAAATVTGPRAAASVAAAVHRHGALPRDVAAGGAGSA